MPGESVGALFLVVVAICLTGVVAVQRRQRHRPSYLAPPSVTEPRRATAFQLVAIAGLVGAAAAIFVYAWAAGFRESGAASLRPMAWFGLPVLAGLAFQWAKQGSWPSRGER